MQIYHSPATASATATGAPTAPASSAGRTATAKRTATGSAAGEPGNGIRSFRLVSAKFAATNFLSRSAGRISCAYKGSCTDKMISNCIALRTRLIPGMPVKKKPHLNRLAGFTSPNIVINCPQRFFHLLSI